MTKLLEAKGIEVSFAIHPVAGRMPGHMNVLLAEADVPYEQLNEMEEANSQFARTDVSLVIGANDVTNPDARGEGRLADLRDADPQRRRIGVGHRPEALDELRASPASTTRSSTTPRRPCSSATRRRRWARSPRSSRHSDGNLHAQLTSRVGEVGSPADVRVAAGRQGGLPPAFSPPWRVPSWDRPRRLRTATSAAPCSCSRALLRDRRGAGDRRRRRARGLGRRLGRHRGPCLAAWVVRATPEDGGGGEDDDGGGGGGKGPPDPGPIDWAAFDRERRHWDRSPAAR